MVLDEVSEKPKRRVAAGLLLTGILGISTAVVLASSISLSQSPSLTTCLDVLLVVGATVGLDIIFYKLMKQPTPTDLDSNRPRLHLFAAAVTFTITVWDGIFFGLTYLHSGAPVDSESLATLTIAGMVVPAGATFILAAAALPGKASK